MRFVCLLLKAQHIASVADLRAVYANIRLPYVEADITSYMCNVCTCNTASALILQLIYPITVASKAAGRQRQDAAAAVLFELRKRNARLVEEAALVSIEMVKVAVTQAELWHEGLEEASRLCFGDGDMDAMLNRLQV
jgi:FKBP12-rapamycin binding domain